MLALQLKDACTVQAVNMSLAHYDAESDLPDALQLLPIRAANAGWCGCL